MYSIKNNIENTIEIKKSKFVTKLFKINNLDEINKILYDQKKQYKDATHICFAYIVNGQEKCFDDGEPSGTAGLPILNIIKKNNLTNILVIVIRYFGGIKLGGGGLVRAYSNSALEALKLTNIIELEEGFIVEVLFDYEQTKKIDYILNNKNIIDKIYNDIITYKFYLNHKELDFISELKNHAIDVYIKEKVLIEKN